MAITSAGYNGTVNDEQWARLFAAHPRWFSDSAFVPSAVSGQRRVALTAGPAFAVGIRDVSDSVTNVDIAPPSSGGQFHLLVLRRTWQIGSGGTTTVVRLPAATNDGTIPTTAPTAAPAGFTQTPSVTDDTPIAWAHVRAADTTVTLFDLRGIPNGDSRLTYPTLHALNVQIALSQLRDGALASVAQHLPSGGATLRPSIWRVRTVDGSTYAVPEGDLQGTAGILTQLTTLLPSLTRLALTRFGGTFGTDEGTGIRYRYVGVGGCYAQDAAAQAASWQAWSKPGVSYTPVVTGLNWTAFATRLALWGITEGMFWTTVQITATSGSAPTNGGDTFLVAPNSACANLGAGKGWFNVGGSTAQNNQYGLATYASGPVGQQTTSVRVRAAFVAATAQAVRENVLGSVVTSFTANDSLQFAFEGPSGAYA